MARPLRIEFPGAFYHVMNRGNTGMDIYRSERDREKFLEYVGEAVKRYGKKLSVAPWLVINEFSEVTDQGSTPIFSNGERR